MHFLDLKNNDLIFSLHYDHQEISSRVIGKASVPKQFSLINQ